MSTELLLTFVRNRSAKDLVVPIVSGTGADVHRAAHRLYGELLSQTLVIERTGVRISEDSDLTDVQLLTGDRVLVGSDGGATAPEVPIARHRLVFEDGPRSGQVVELDSGETRIGRGDDRVGVIGIPDDTVSKLHAKIYVEGTSVEIEDRGSRNGTDLNGSPIASRTAIASGDRVRIGDSTGRFELAEAAGERMHLARSGGRIAFNREPRVVSRDPARAFEAPDVPATPQRRRFPLPAAVLPFVAGIVMFLVIGNPIFLIFTAMAPIMVVWTTIDDRRSGRRSFRTESVEFRSELAEIEAELETVRETRALWLSDKFPRTGTLADRASLHDSRLWRRRPNNDDFLSIRIGTGSLPTASSLKLGSKGDAELIAEAEVVKEAYEVEQGLPIEVSLIDHPVVGVVREDGGLSDLVRALIGQVVCDQSPRDAALAVLAPQYGGDWEWAKWLPHVASLGDDLRLVAAGDEQAKALFGGLKGLVDQRLKDADQSIDSGRSRFLPHVVVVFHPPAKISRREVTEFLERAPRAGMSILWLASDKTALPGECTAVIDADDRVTLTFTASGQSIECDNAEQLSAQRVSELARSLAPLDDVSSGADSVIPTRIDLLELLQCTDVGPADVARSWAEIPAGLQAVIGADADGAVRVDWRRDGPHALVAGTTGAGKSELLQSLVASMAFLYSPRDVTFVLIDYKGGSAFKDCEALPHTVGMVTDLDDHLASRALISLGAELHHRERLLNTVGAKDIIEMKEKAPDSAPPNLLIIIDEFAALKNEVPEFVDGVVDIAQRGRSLGVHLLLATQQPNGVIDPKIQGNTNLRIALRVADASDSNDVIGRRDAHEISKSLPGRGYVRTGPTEIDEFQSAYVGGKGSTELDLDAKTFSYGMVDVAGLVKGNGEASADSATDLQRLVAAVQGAHESSGQRRPRLPWVDALDPLVDYSALVSTKPPPMAAVIGVADYPVEQTQRPFMLDFTEHSNHVIYGASGSGKTTFLRTVITDLALRNSPDHLWIYVLDYASQGLTALRSLPHCGGVIGSDDLNRTRRLLEMLVGTVNIRRQQLRDTSASNPDEYESTTGKTMPRVLVAIDGFGQLWQALDNVDRSVHLATLTSLILEGRAVGIHFVLTADTRRSVSPMVSSSVGGRFMLRMSEPDEYLGFGLRHLVKSSAPTNGRAFTPEGVEIQVGVMRYRGETTGSAQSEAILALASHIKRGTTPVPPVELLPELVSLDSLAYSGAGTVVGVSESDLSPIAIDLDDDPTFIIFGPDRGGRSTAAAVIAAGLRPLIGESYLLSGRRSPLADDASWTGTATGLAESEALAQTLKEKLDEWEQRTPVSPTLIVIEDGGDFKDGAFAATLDKLVQRGRDLNVIVVATLTTFVGSKSYAPWIRLLRSNRHGLILQPDVEEDGDLFGIRLPRRSGLDLPVGRAMLVRRSGVELIQVALGSTT